MKRKISLTILLVTGFALFGCGEETVSAHEHTEETVSAHEHTYASSWESSSTHHWHESTCEHDIKKDFAEHAFEDTVTKEATYDSQGSVTHVCKVCDYSYSERTPKLSHNYSNEWSINAQKHWRVCVDEGYEWMKTDLANHTFSIETIEPTCLDEGYDIRTCDVCGYSEKTNYVDALGHEYEDIVYEPTYDAGGYTKHTCKVCGYSYEDAITDKLKYTITWEDWDGSILRVDNLERGEMPSYGEDPKKDMSQYETYSFKGWDPAIAPASCNITYKATYDTSVSEDEFTVLFEPNGGDDFYVSLTKRKGEPLTLPSEQPHREGYVFYGWNNVYEETIYGSEDEFNDDFNVTFFAMWVPICQNCKGSGGVSNTICRHCEGEGKILIHVAYGVLYNCVKCTACNGTGKVAEVLDCKKCAAVGFVFEDGPEVEKVTIREITLCKTDGYEYSIDGSNWQTSSTFGGLTPNTTYSFCQRKASAGRVPFGATSKSTAVTTLRTSYTITYVLNGGINDSENPTSYSYESGDILLRDPTRDGYTFGGWYNDKSLKSKTDGITSGSSGDLIFYAKWVANLNKLSAEPNGSSRGTVKITGVGYSGEGIEVKATPLPTYSFKGWYADEKFISGRNPYKFIMPTHDYSLTAVFMTKSETSEYEKNKALGMEPGFSASSDTLTYGLYPQTRVSNGDLISSLNEITDVEGNGWYLYDGSYYAKKAANPYKSDYKFTDGTTITEGTEYWFRCEPIEWKILSSSDGTHSLVSSELLDAHRYNSSSSARTIDGETVYANNYEHSGIRSWLNGDFYDSAFALDDSLIQAVTVDNSAATTDSATNKYACNDTQDKVYLLSYQDYVNADYFANSSSRCCKPTDWAMANGAFASTDSGYYGNGWYWTRSPRSDYSYGAWLVDRDGFLDLDRVICSYYCVRPSLQIKVA